MPEKNSTPGSERAVSFLHAHAASIALEAGVPFAHVWLQMNYSALVGEYRAALTSKDAGCLSCGCEFSGPLDIRLVYRHPPRDPRDWERLHARNLMLLCASCAEKKSDKPFAAWLDEMEEERKAKRGKRTPPKAAQ